VGAEPGRDICAANLARRPRRARNVRRRY